MFERFSDASRRVLLLGQHAARDLRHGRIGTEHVLMALMALEDLVAYEALRISGVTSNVLRSAVTHFNSVGEIASTAGHLPLSPHALTAFDRAAAEAARSGSQTVEPGHILLALLHNDDCRAVQVLTSVGVSLAMLRWCVGILSERPAAVPVQDAGAVTRRALAELLINAIEGSAHLTKDGTEITHVGGRVSIAKLLPLLETIAARARVDG